MKKKFIDGSKYCHKALLCMFLFAISLFSFAQSNQLQIEINKLNLEQIQSLRPHVEEEYVAYQRNPNLILVDFNTISMELNTLNVEIESRDSENTDSGLSGGRAEANNIDKEELLKKKETLIRQLKEAEMKKNLIERYVELKKEKQ